MTLHRLPTSLQIIDRQTLRTAKDLQVLRPAHRRITRHTPPRGKILGRRGTRKAFLRARRQRREGVRQRQIGHLVAVIIIVVVGIQEVLLLRPVTALVADGWEWVADGSGVTASLAWGGGDRGGPVHERWDDGGGTGADGGWVRGWWWRRMGGMARRGAQRHRGRI